MLRRIAAIVQLPATASSCRTSPLKGGDHAMSAKLPISPLEAGDVRQDRGGSAAIEPDQSRRAVILRPVAQSALIILSSFFVHTPSSLPHNARALDERRRRCGTTKKCSGGPPPSCSRWRPWLTGRRPLPPYPLAGALDLAARGRCRRRVCHRNRSARHRICDTRSWLTATTKRLALPQHSASLPPSFSHWPIRCSVWR